MGSELPASGMIEEIVSIEYNLLPKQGNLIEINVKMATVGACIYYVPFNVGVSLIV
jgi:hypothetical protein